MWRVALAGLVLVAVIGGVLLHDTLFRTALTSIGQTAGYGVNVRTLHVGWGQAAASDVNVTTKAGEPLLSVQEIRAEYSLPDFIAGKRRFGLKTLELEKPLLTVIHHRDGSYNAQLPAQPKNAPPEKVPLNLRVRVRDGGALLLDRYLVLGHERIERIRNADFEGVFSPSERSWYQGGFALEDAGRSYPVWGRAAFDSARSFNAQHWHADELPLGPLVNFTLKSHAYYLGGGRLLALDARAYDVLGDAGKASSLHSLSARLQGGVVHTLSLSKPVRDISGLLRFFGDGFETPGVDATLAGVPIHLVGGVYNLSSPSFRFLVTGRGELVRLRQMVASAQRKPVSGMLGFSLFIEGLAERPLTLAHLASERIKYDPLVLVQPRGSMAFSGTQAYILSVRANVENVQADARAWVDLRRRTEVRLFAQAEADSNAIANLARLVPDQRLHAAAVVRGFDSKLAAEGMLWGQGAGGSLRAPFHLTQAGVGSIGPLALERADGGALTGIALLDRPANTIAGMGRLRGSLGAFLAGVPSRGSVDAHFAGFVRGGQTVVQLSDAVFKSAELWGVPLRDANATLGLHKNRVDVYAASLHGAGGAAFAQGSFGNGGRLDATLRDIDMASLQAFKLPVRDGRLTGVANVQGTQAAPSGRLGLTLSHASFAGVPLEGQASLAYADALLGVRDVSLLYAGAYGTAWGDVRDPARNSRLNLRVHLKAVDFAMMARVTRAKLPYPVEGSLDADARLMGKANAPLLAGTVSVPEGSVNGLRFGQAGARFDGSPGAVAVQQGRIRVGSTQIGFTGHAAQAAQSLQVNAPRVDAADFNDFFDEGGVLGGRGSLRLDVSHAGSSLDGGSFAGNVNATLADTRFRTFQLGTSALRVHSSAGFADGTLDVTGAHGAMRSTARVALLDPSRWFQATARLQNLDMATWLPAAGINLPLVGGVDGLVRAQGPLNAPLIGLQASLHGGLAWRVPINRLDVNLRADRRRIDITEAALDVPSLTVRTSGTVAIAPDAPFNLSVRALSPDIGAFTSVASGRKIEANGALNVNAGLSGTLSSPRSNVQATLSKLQVSQAQEHFSGDLSAQLQTAGTLQKPTFRGSLALNGATLSSHLLRSPLHNGMLAINFSDTSATLSRLHLEASGGSLDATASALFADIRSFEQTLDARATLVAQGFRVDAPTYVRGTIDGNVTLQRSPGAAPLVGGNLVFNSTRIPLNALLPAPPSEESRATPFPVAFNLGITADRDVRVQSGNVDIGARGRVVLGGTLAAPTLSGRFNATGGSVSFYRTFALQSGLARFSPDSGVIPFVDATATTSVSNPDADILLHMHGPASNLSVDFASNPSYSREQILGLLTGVQAFGAVAGVPGSRPQTGNQPSLLQSTALGYVNQQFTRSLLEPLQSSLGQSLGVQNLQLNAGLSGTYGGSFSKTLGKNLTASYAQSYGQIQRRTIGLQKRFRNATTLQLSFFSASGAYQVGSISGLDLVDPTKPLDLSLLSLIPPAGTSGFTLSYQHRFW